MCLFFCLKPHFNYGLPTCSCSLSNLVQKYGDIEFLPYRLAQDVMLFYIFYIPPTNDAFI